MSVEAAGLASATRSPAEQRRLRLLDELCSKILLYGAFVLMF